jgi:uncharacterized damage-inducible protein DinB
MSLTYFKTLVNYNVWANQKICGFITHAGDAMARLEQQSSFPSVYKTLIHIWGAEWIWLLRLKNESPASFPAANFSGSLEEACAGWLKASTDFEKEILSFSDAEALSRQVIYRNLKGEPFISTVQEVVSHCMNHSTFHRGQLVTLLRGAGYKELGSTDMITYYREKA